MSLVYAQGKDFFYIFDTPHIIKAMRNNLINYNFYFSGKVASWEDIKFILEHDKQQKYRCCPKLTRNHLYPDGFHKTKVKLAT